MSAAHFNWTEPLCLKEIAPWLSRPLDRGTLMEGFARYNATHRSIFLLAIEQGAVRLLDKPGFRVRAEFNEGSTAVADDAGLIYKEEFIRAHMYRAFFQRVLAHLRLPLSITVAIDVNDDPIQQASVPVFAFQKRRGSNTLLIPDVDFLHNRFYVPAEFRDRIAYRDKTPTAIFAGSTTGGRTITEDGVRSLSIPRLRSAIFFRDKERVDFRLPRIVQCASHRTQEMIEALGFGVGRCPWAEQFTHRLIMSMDGNGATCSRVAIALKSRGVLVKYDSPHLLYYFNELIPWRHYIPVSTDEDILDLAEVEERRPGVFQSIAEEGRAFAKTHLSPEGVTAYTGALLAMYAGCLGDEGPWPPVHGVRADPGEERTRVSVDAGAHIQGLGDVWAWPDGWAGEPGSGRAIEAIIVVPDEPLELDDVEYRVMLQDGALSEWARAGELCGTLGQDAPLRGFCLRLGASAAQDYECIYQASFVGGHTLGPFRAGELCAADTTARLEAFRVEIARKRNREAAEP